MHVYVSIGIANSARDRIEDIRYQFPGENYAGLGAIVDRIEAAVDAVAHVIRQERMDAQVDALRG